jgi:diguanylate cyclase (GGDEF)-like protein/PAS domain S-box-containing protein
VTSSSVSETGSRREVSLHAEPPEARLLNYRKALQELKTAGALVTGDIEGALVQLTELGADLLDMDRVSVWHLSADARTLECVHTFTRGGGHTQGGALGASAHPAYFDALRRERVVVVSDARRDPRTRELCEPFYQGVGARLDAPVFLRGQWVGVICHEHMGGQRSFAFWEELVAGMCADFVALVLQAREQLRAEAQLKHLRTRVDDLLESHTSAVVRENADLQREVDSLQLLAETMRKSEDERRKLFAASPVPMLLVRARDRKVLLTNEKCARALRCGVSDLEELDVSELFVRPSDLEALLVVASEGGEVDGKELELRAHDGHGFWALLSARKVEFHGEPSVMLGFSDLTAQKAVEHQLRVLAQRDPLTHAYNRHHFWHLATSELARVRRYQRPLAVAMLDADFFKKVNDEYGHDAGDLVLRSIVDTCQLGLRASDVLARYGGEEFIVLLPETSLDGAFAVMNRLRERIASTPVQLEDGHELRITVSVGISELRDTDRDLEALIKRADDALYAAKRNGRDRVECSA